VVINELVDGNDGGYGKWEEYDHKNIKDVCGKYEEPNPPE